MTQGSFVPHGRDDIFNTAIGKPEHPGRVRAARRSSRECCTLDGKSPVAESITSLRSDPSSMGQLESHLTAQSASSFEAFVVASL